ncbi:response regulator [Actinomadura welshii]
MRVLIVEDDARVARLLRTVLRRDGYETVLAERGDAGWRELTGPDPPVLLILDRMLPDMDGADLLARLRADDRIARLPVLMLTADIHTSRALDDGALTRVLPKPFDLADLRATCAVLCPGGRT